MKRLADWHTVTNHEFGSQPFPLSSLAFVVDLEHYSRSHRGAFARTSNIEGCIHVVEYQVGQ